MEINLTVNTAYTISVYILLVSTFVSTLELSSIPALYLDFVYPSIKVKNKYSRWRVFNYVLLSLVLLAFLFFSFGEIKYFKITFLLITGGVFYLYKVRTVSKDGADQMRLLALLSFSLCFLVENEKGMLLSVVFVGAQVLIAYATSGIAKLLSPSWRKGNLLSGILSTYSYGIPGISLFLKKHPVIEKLVSHSAIITMILVPVCFFIPQPEFIYISLCCIFLFHFSTAVLMGLNDFLLTFPLTYPGVLILHGIVHGYLTVGQLL